MPVVFKTYVNNNIQLNDLNEIKTTSTRVILGNLQMFVFKLK